MEPMYLKRVRESALLPTRATPGSAGLDLYACIPAPLALPPGGHLLVPTGIALQLPSPDLAAFVFARSGLAIRHGIGLLNGVGVVDSDYTGEIQVGLVNQGSEAYQLLPQERIAQLVILPVALLAVVEVEELSETQRGEGGFGSTGRR